MSVLFLLFPNESYASVKSPEANIQHQVNAPTVNGCPTNKVSYVIDDNKRVTFTYTGNDDVIRWSFVAKDGTSYTLDDFKDQLTVISIDGHTLVLAIKDWSGFEAPNGVTLNLQTSSRTTASGIKDTSSTSPATGFNITNILPAFVILVTSVFGVIGALCTQKKLLIVKTGRKK